MILIFGRVLVLLSSRGLVFSRFESRFFQQPIVMFDISHHNTGKALVENVQDIRSLGTREICLSNFQDEEWLQKVSLKRHLACTVAW